MVDSTFVTKNHLLAGLPADDLARLLPHFTPVTFPLGDVLYESGVALRHLYFPTSSVVSLLFVTESGASTELAVTGREGVVGIGLFMGGESTPSRAVVQIAGNAFRLPYADMHREFRLGGAFQLSLLRFTQTLITQMSQTAVCNRHHSVEQQLCRWLLLSFDRVDSSELRMTQQLIADMLGVRREGVTVAAAKLQEWGCIRYSRGLIKVADRDGLESRVSSVIPSSTANMVACCEKLSIRARTLPTDNAKPAPRRLLPTVDAPPSRCLLT